MTQYKLQAKRVTSSKTIAHGVVQGLQNMAKGGRFQHGFLTSVMGKVSGKLRSLVTAGTASAIGGGKFLNGAASGSFSYLFNNVGNSLKNIAKKLINLPAQIISHGAYYAGMNVKRLYDMMKLLTTLATAGGI